MGDKINGADDYTMSTKMRALLERVAGRLSRYSKWLSGEPQNDTAMLEIEVRDALGEYDRCG